MITFFFFFLGFWGQFFFDAHVKFLMFWLIEFKRVSSCIWVGLAEVVLLCS
jgi:hypothetical protein